MLNDPQPSYIKSQVPPTTMLTMAKTPPTIPLPERPRGVILPAAPVGEAEEPPLPVGDGADVCGVLASVRVTWFSIPDE